MKVEESGLFLISAAQSINYSHIICIYIQSCVDASKGYNNYMTVYGKTRHMGFSMEIIEFDT